jgi:hypothetical protein
MADLIDLGNGNLVDPDKDIVILNGVPCRVSASWLGPVFTPIRAGDDLMTPQDPAND